MRLMRKMARTITSTATIRSVHLKMRLNIPRVLLVLPSYGQSFIRRAVGGVCSGERRLLACTAGQLAQQLLDSAIRQTHLRGVRQAAEHGRLAACAPRSFASLLSNVFVYRFRMRVFLCVIALAL